MMKNFVVILCFGGFVLVMLFSSCMKERYYQGDLPIFSLTTDTIRFDTVFTTRGSTTQWFKIRNQEDVIVEFTVSLGQQTPFFRMNIDGIKTKDKGQVKILPNDSIYVFVEATIDPNNPPSISPFIIEDYITVQSKKAIDTVCLEAWGQNANYIPGSNAGGLISILSCDLGTVRWDDPKPYVLNGLLIIDSCTLELPPGTKLYIHGGYANNEIGIYQDGLILVQNKGSIRANGTLDNPVIIEGTRLEPSFDDVPGQYNGIRFVNGSQNNMLKYAYVRNGVINILVDSSSMLELEQSYLMNGGVANLVGIHSLITAKNSVFAQAGNVSVQLSYGGNYAFEYCTIDNIGDSQSSSLTLNNFTRREVDGKQTTFVNKLDATLINTVVSSNNSNGTNIAYLENTFPSEFSLKMDHCAISFDEEFAGDFPDIVEQCASCIQIFRKDTIYIAPEEFDYRLDTLNKLDGAALPTTITVDIIEQLRDNAMPDIGAFERVN